ncbi:hypothetical protein A3Q56_07842 [Intoshia linei]|uniref:Tropomyosin n=1 Tax=Intoshia linei TaxID=1819745 RepID=A0A177AR28_9BILA|nr:hypothetical protein A3Q56_07842 [Intoshia linei]
MNHSNIVTSIKEKMNQFRISNAALSDEISALKQTLSENSIKIEEYENKVATLTRKVAQLEDENEKLELNFASQTEKLNTSIQMADDSERLKAALSQQYNAELDVKDKISCNVKSLEDKLTEFENKYREYFKRKHFRTRKVLENRTSADEERIEKLEKELQTYMDKSSDADRSYEETAQKLAITETDLEKSEGRLENLELKITGLEEELSVVGNNMKSLEISEQEVNCMIICMASQREDAHKESIRELSDKFKEVYLFFIYFRNACLNSRHLGRNV